MSRERREARRAFYEKKKKEAYHLLKRLNAVSPKAHGWHSQTNMVPLEKPIRRGWVRFFKVRDDLIKSPEGRELEQVLSHIQNSELCANRNFTKKVRKGRYKSVRQPIEQELKNLTTNQFEELPENLQSHFYRAEVTERWGGPRVVYCVKHPWKFEFKVKPHYITQVPLSSSEAESEYAWISRKLYDEAMLMKYLEHTSDGEKSWRKKERAKEKQKARQEIEQALQDLRDEYTDSLYDDYYYDYDDMY